MAMGAPRDLSSPPMTQGKQALLAQVLREAGRPVDVPALLASLLMPLDVLDAAVGNLLPGEPEAPPPLLPFHVTYEYTEVVEGAERRFLHQTVVEAQDAGAARVAALAHFGQLEGASGAGWTRTLLRYHVAASVPRGRPS
jgi:hypothetical protein